MLKKVIILNLLWIIIFIAGCSYLPHVRQLDVSQGNVITQEMVNSIKPGMSREQVEYILGSPMLKSPFAVDRMYYIYSFKAGGAEAYGDELVLSFENNKLTGIKSSLEPGDIVLPQP